MPKRNVPQAAYSLALLPFLQDSPFRLNFQDRSLVLLNPGSWDHDPLYNRRRRRLSAPKTLSRSAILSDPSATFSSSCLSTALPRLAIDRAEIKNGGEVSVRPSVRSSVLFNRLVLRNGLISFPALLAEEDHRQRTRPPRPAPLCRCPSMEPYSFDVRIRKHPIFSPRTLCPQFAIRNLVNCLISSYLGYSLARSSSKRT